MRISFEDSRNSDVKELEINRLSSQNSVLSIFNFEEIKFDPKRIFYVTTDEKVRRGNHAHRDCSQIFLCIKGTIEIGLYDGSSRDKRVLNEKSKAILIPPGIWAYQEYESDSVLLVAANRDYSEKDYIRNIKDFEGEKTKL